MDSSPDLTESGKGQKTLGYMIFFIYNILHVIYNYYILHIIYLLHIMTVTLKTPGLLSMK